MREPRIAGLWSAVGGFRLVDGQLLERRERVFFSRTVAQHTRQACGHSDTPTPAADMATGEDSPVPWSLPESLSLR